MVISARARTAGDDVERDGRCSRHRWRSSLSVLPSKRCFHPEEEDDEGDLLETVVELGAAALAGDLRGEGGGRTVQGLGFRGPFPEREEEREEERGEEEREMGTSPLGSYPHEEREAGGGKAAAANLSSMPSFLTGTQIH